jgi:hypothetical protein
MMGHILKQYSQPVASSRGRSSSSSSSSSSVALESAATLDQHLTTLVEILSKQPLKLVDRLLDWPTKKSLMRRYLEPSVWKNLIVSSPYYHQLLKVASTALTSQVNENDDDDKKSWSINVKDEEPDDPLVLRTQRGHPCECKECKAVHQFLVSTSQREYKVGGSGVQRKHVRGTHDIQQYKHMGLIKVSPVVKGETTLVITKTPYDASSSPIAPSFASLNGTCTSLSYNL